MSTAERSAEQDLYVVGAGGHGREVYSYIQELIAQGWRGTLRGYLDDALPPGFHRFLEVVGSLDSLKLQHGSRETAYLTAVGSNTARLEIVRKIEALYRDAMTPWALVHPRAYVGQSIEVGAGTCIAPGAILTTDIKVGRHTIVNVRASISHDCEIGDYVNVNPSATICGWVQVGEGAYVGAGATVKDRVKIGAWSVVGAGAVVIHDVPADVTVVGVPARIIKHTGLRACKATSH